MNKILNKIEKFKKKKKKNEITVLISSFCGIFGICVSSKLTALGKAKCNEALEISLFIIDIANGSENASRFNLAIVIISMIIF